MTANDSSSDDPVVAIDQLLASIWTRRWLLSAAVVLGAVGGAVFGLLSDPVYRAEVTILPTESGDQFSSLRGFADLVGASIEPAGDLAPLYPEIVYSDTILDPVVLREWDTNESDSPIPFRAFFEIDPELSTEEQTERVKLILIREIVDVNVDKSTGYARIIVDMPRDPRLAAGLANHLAGALHEYVLQHHRRRAAQKRDFIESQLSLVLSDLTAAEERLVEFTAQNRAFQESPDLVLIHERLLREVELQGRLYGELKIQYENARIQVADESHGLSILDSATPPTRPHAPRIGILVVAGAFLGVVAFGTAILVQSVVGSVSRQSSSSTSA